MSNCVNLKLKLDRSLECRLTGKSITWNQCKNCPLRKLKLNNMRPIKQRTGKLSKAERNRFSILTEDMDHCIICGKKKDNLHEVFFGRNRLNSIKYGMVIPLCIEHHLEIHKNSQLQDIWHIKGQKEFNKHYPELDFTEIFKINYL